MSDYPFENIRHVEDIEFVEGIKIPVVEAIDVPYPFPTSGSYSYPTESSAVLSFYGHPFPSYLQRCVDNYPLVADGNINNMVHGSLPPVDIPNKGNERIYMITNYDTVTYSGGGVGTWDNVVVTDLNTSKYESSGWKTFISCSYWQGYNRNGELHEKVWSVGSGGGFSNTALIRTLTQDGYMYTPIQLFEYYNSYLEVPGYVKIFFISFGRTSELIGNLLSGNTYTQEQVYAKGTPSDPTIPQDPFGPGGNSGTGEYPPGTFDDSSDAISDSPLPTLSMADTGFTRIFNPTLSQVNALAQYLWKTEDILETVWNKIKQVFENPMDVMIAFNIVPVPVPNSSPIDFTILYIPTGVMISPATTQFVDVDCGSLELDGYYGAALDYSPYTKIHCYLPYIGMVTLDTDEVMNRTLSVKYRVDIVSGGCVAKIFVDGNVLYQYSGHCSISVPFSASDFSQYMNAMLKVSALAIGAAGAGIGVALGAGAASDAAQQTSQMVERTTITNTARNPNTGRQITTGTQTIEVEKPESTSTTKASYDGLSPANVVNTVGQVMGGKPVAQHSGSFNGNTGYLGVRYPYLVIERPRQCLPSNYQRLNGYPSMITLSLGSCTGYTRVQQVQLTGLSATNPEQAEILQLLKGGVVF